jgi:hypothetical protein
MNRVTAAGYPVYLVLDPDVDSKALDAELQHHGLTLKRIQGTNLSAVVPAKSSGSGPP